MSHERLSPTASSDGYNMPDDVREHGVMLYTMVYGRHPFMTVEVRNTLKLRMKVSEDNLRFLRNTSPELRALIMGMIERDADRWLFFQDLSESKWRARVSCDKGGMDAAFEEASPKSAVIM